MSGPRRDDAKAANAARPRDYEYSDSERYDDYLMAVDPDYQIDFYLRQGDVEAARDVAERRRERRMEDDDWTDEDEVEFALAWEDDE